MTTFDRRKEAFETKFAQDEELHFRAVARRNRLLGLWAAAKLGLSGAKAEAYAEEVMAAELDEAGNHDVFRKIRLDFYENYVRQSDHQIHRTMDELMMVAMDQIKRAG
jgi:hypothetical protein